MEEEKVKVVVKTKKSTGKTITIIILILLIIGLSTYIGIEYYQKLTVKKAPKEIEETEEKELTYREAETLLKQIEDYNEGLSKYYPITNYDQIENETKVKFGIYLLEKYENTKNYYQTVDIKRVLNSYFTSDFKVVYEDIMCDQKDGNLYTLNQGSYRKEKDHEHGEEKMKIDTFYVESKKLDDIYKITVNILYSDYCNGTCPRQEECYDSWENASTYNNKVLTSIEEYEENKEEIAKTTFTFLKKEGSYQLKNVKVTNP